MQNIKTCKVIKLKSEYTQHDQRIWKCMYAPELHSDHREILLLSQQIVTELEMIAYMNENGWMLCAVCPTTEDDAIGNEYFFTKITFTI